MLTRHMQLPRVGTGVIFKITQNRRQFIRPQTQALSPLTYVAMKEAANASPWHAAYPAPRNTEPGKITREELLELLKTNGKVAGRDFVLVDLRRNDYEVRSKRRHQAFPLNLDPVIHNAILGRYDSGFAKFASSKPLPNHTGLLCHATCRCRG